MSVVQFNAYGKKNLSPLEEAFFAVNNRFQNYGARDKPAQHERAMQKTTLLSIVIVLDRAVGAIAQAQQPKKATDRVFSVG